MPLQQQLLDDELLGLHAETVRLALAMSDPAIQTRLAEMADELLELACRDARTLLVGRATHSG